jgi:hypothetical protein
MGLMERALRSEKKSTKSQQPSSKEIPMFKLQMSRKQRALEIEGWSFFGVWSLGFGAYSTFYPHTPTAVPI